MWCLKWNIKVEIKILDLILDWWITMCHFMYDCVIVFSLFLSLPPRIKIERTLQKVISDKWNSTLRITRIRVYIGITRLAKITILYHDCSGPWSKERGNYLSCTEGKGCGKDIHSSAQNDALFIYICFSFLFLYLSFNSFNYRDSHSSHFFSCS